jgi:hypothetical protein
VTAPEHRAGHAGQGTSDTLSGGAVEIRPREAELGRPRESDLIRPRESELDRPREADLSEPG